jgi:hypothetical protein
MKQNARTEEGVLALYIASKLDPHYLVRVRAEEALDILTIAHRECFTELLKGADVLVAQLRKLKYKPGSENCRLVLANACCAMGMSSAAPPMAPSSNEPIPPPKGLGTTVKPAAEEISLVPMPPVPGTPLEPLPR